MQGNASIDGWPNAMDGLTLFGLFAVTSMLATYALEKRSRWFVLAFALSCLLDQPMDSFKAHGRSGW